MKSTNPETPQVRFSPVGALTPYARNSRTHSPSQIQAIVRSIEEFGWTNVCLADEQGIVAGHGRVLAAEIIYAKGGTIRFPNGAPVPAGMVPWIDCEGWSPEQRKAYIIGDNQTALLAGWDLDVLRSEMECLQAANFDVTLTGFSNDDLLDLFDGPVAETKDPDEVPEVPEVPYSKMGDMWVCGPHRVRCGDSTSLADWSALMQGELADLQICDPPYNVAYESTLAGSIKNDNMKDRAFREFLLGFYRCSFSVLKPGAAMYVAHADSEGANFRGALKEAGFALKSCLIWIKNSLVLGRGDFHYRHEPILYATKPGAPRRWHGGRKQTTLQDFGDTPVFQRLEDGRYAITNGDSLLYVAADACVEEAPSTLLRFDKPKRSAMHPTEKPVALWERLARNNGRTNDLVVDGFGGSGTTMIMADRLGMCSRLLEFDERFVDVIAVRYANYTGRVPVHAVTGDPFPTEVIDRLTKKWEGT